MMRYLVQSARVELDPSAAATFLLTFPFAFSCLTSVLLGSGFSTGSVAGGTFPPLTIFLSVSRLSLIFFVGLLRKADLSFSGARSPFSPSGSVFPFGGVFDSAVSGLEAVMEVASSSLSTFSSPFLFLFSGFASQGLLYYNKTPRIKTWPIWENVYCTQSKRGTSCLSKTSLEFLQVLGKVLEWHLPCWSLACSPSAMKKYIGKNTMMSLLLMSDAL